MKGTNEFNFIPAKSLDDALIPEQPSRLFSKDIKRSASLPAKVSDGVRLSGIRTVLYWANASAGYSTGLVSLPSDLPHSPVYSVWYMGSVDKEGVAYPYSKPLNGGPTNIHFSATAYVSATSDYLSVSVDSINVGWPVFITAYFYYVVYYDELLELKEVGL